MDLQVLPLAVTMMVGPQIMSAILLVTTRHAVRASLAFLAGVTAATAAGLALSRGVFALLGQGVSLGDPSDRGSAGTIIQFVLVALLLAAAVRSYAKRETAKPPRWLGTLMDAGPRKAFEIGTLVILLMPSDIMVMLTVGAHLEQRDLNLAAALPFLAATVLIAALPLLALLLFRKRMSRAMPKVREWMNTHSWVVNIAAYVIFILLIL
ncbi:GAP family protein [Actinomadura soli]|uniref:GAP family protein n=1 Tax=Actinomadura soli TaxID=2508997 RepID=A0A5C4J4X3_9ACTN|nr:GAP family protein [Actinomadura soli]TMQ92003.1 GAP family protein [Actinomadura soli]